MAESMSLFSRGEGRDLVIDQDCRQGLKSLEDNSASLVLTDPPYFIDGMGEDWNLATLKQRAKQGVVGGIPAGQKFEVAQGRKLQKFLYPVACELLRILRPGSFLLCFSQARLSHRTAIAFEEAGFEIRDLLAWTYEGQAKAFSQEHFVRKMDLPAHKKEEMIRKLGGRKTPQLKPQMEPIVLAQKPREGTLIENWMRYETGLVDVANPLLEPGRFPGTLIPCKKPRSRHGHMTVKPVEACRHLVRIFSTEGSTVLDPFAGSGTTGVAALNEGRGFIGFEIDKAMAATANQRLSAEGERL